MAVQPDWQNESHTGTTGSTSQASFTWDHFGSVSGVQGVLIFTFVANATGDLATGVTYGGATVPAVTGGRAADTATEPGDCKAWFLGSSVPQGTQAVVVTRTNNASIMYAVSITFRVSAGIPNLETTGVVLLQEDGAYAQQSINDGSPGTNSLRCAGGYYGGAAPPPAGADSTLLHSIDLGAFGCAVVKETTAGQGSRLVGFTQATSDDRAAVHLAVREVVAPSVTVQRRVEPIQLVPVYFPNRW